MAHVTFIHGIGNKPKPDALLEQWKQALTTDNGIDLDTKGVTSSLVYWADVLYDEPKLTEGAQESLSAAVESEFAEESTVWQDSLEGIEKDFVDRLTAKLDSNLESFGESAGSALEGIAGSELERIPLPGPLKKRIMKRFLRDVHHYLFNTEHSLADGRTFKVQDEIRKRFIERLEQDAADNQDGKHIVISHSMGTVIAYDCLKRVTDCPAIDGLFTVGSPLGIDEVQDQLKPEWQSHDGFPSSKLNGLWANVFNRADLVSLLDAPLADDYQKGGKLEIIDMSVPNRSFLHHDFVEYVRSQQLRNLLRVVLAL